MSIAQEDELILLQGKDGKQFIVRLERGGELQTHRGCISHDDILDSRLGREIQSHLGYPFLALEPSTADLITKLKRTTQIMFPKDIGYTILRLNIRPGSTVIEAGTGSGGLTLALARAIAPSGQVFSYEVRPDILELAKANLQSLGVADCVVFRLRDIAEGFCETDVNALFLDVRRPWAYMSHVLSALADGGFFGAILPTTNQVAELVNGLEVSQAFGNIEVEEVLVRPYKPVPTRLRPADRMVAHTGYLVFARKVSREATIAGYWVDKRRRKHEEREAQARETQGD